MYAPTIASPRWTTSSFSDAADTTPAELSVLGAHMARCQGSLGHWFGMQCAADALHKFVCSRIVTTLLAGGALIAVAAFIL